MRTFCVNRKKQECFVFEENNIQYHAVMRYFKVLEEGEEDGFFFRDQAETWKAKEGNAGTFQEPKVKWRKSKAKRILYDFLRNGTVPLVQTDADGNETMPVEDILKLHKEFEMYDPDKFESRLRSLRKKILELDDRAAEDRKAFDIFNKNHQVSHFSHKGYIQWQGSDAQELIWDDIEDGKLESMTKKELWESRPEYKEEFPLEAFRKKIEQEIRTSKYVHTVRKKGVLHPAS